MICEGIVFAIQTTLLILNIKFTAAIHKHCDKTPPKNGAVICDFQYHGQFCMAMCKLNYDFESNPKVSLYICIFEKGTWVTDPRDEELLSLNKTVLWPDCAEKDPNELRRGTEFQYFEGECFNPHVRSEMHQNFLEQFQTAALGRFIGCNPHSPERCAPKNVSIICYTPSREDELSSNSTNGTSSADENSAGNLFRSSLIKGPTCAPGTTWYALIDPDTYARERDAALKRMNFRQDLEQVYDPSFADKLTSNNLDGRQKSLCKRCICSDRGTPVCAICRREFYECNDVIRSQCYPGVSLQLGTAVLREDQAYNNPSVNYRATGGGLCECAYCKTDSIMMDSMEDPLRGGAGTMGITNFGFSWELYSKYVELTCSTERARNIAMYHQHEINHVLTGNMLKTLLSNQSSELNPTDMAQYLKPNILALWNVIIKHPSHFASAHYPPAPDVLLPVPPSQPEPKNETNI